VHSASVADLIERVAHPALRAVWDFGNAFAAGEDPAEGQQQLGQHLGYVHVKDGVLVDGHWRLTRLGEGDVPLARVIRDLAASGYRGGLCVEWERAWHPDLDPADMALPAALAAMRHWLADLTPQ
jgi:sugar phosphate isomerase/epimerase